jgi:DNA replication ATP-dependent helicase Dna2
MQKEQAPMSEREIVDALEEELRVSSKPLKFTVSEVKPDGPTVYKVFVDLYESSSRGLDESLEGAAAWWPGPPKGTADVLSVSAEHEQINLRFLTAPPPKRGDEIRVYPPRYLEALKDFWESPLFARESLDWLHQVTSLDYPPLPEVSSVTGFRKLHVRQRQAFGLLEREFGFLWGPPGTGKTYTLGALVATFLLQRPQAKVLLLATTNWAVDLALLSVDGALEELGRKEPKANTLRRKCKRIGTHFIASNYKDREHLLPAIDAELVKRIAELETQRPDRNKAAEYATWKDKINALRAQIPRPIDQAQLAAMTTTSAAFSFGALQQRRPFELIAFDEASQVSLPHALALAPLGRKCIFAGDHKQLAPIVQSQHPDSQKWLGISMFRHMNASNCCFLNEQFRMAEEICEIVSHVFYEGELVLAEGCEQDPLWRTDRRVQFAPGMGTERVHLEKCEAEGEFKKTKYGIGTRYKSAEYIGKIAGVLAAQAGQENVLVLTPFRAQRALIKTFLNNSGLRRVRVSTVHRAQGSECHTVIFDPVIATGERLLGHPEEGPRLLNVALSRAMARLVIIMSAGDGANEYLRRVAHAISGTGHFDGAIDLRDLAADPDFPNKYVGKVVSWGLVVGPIEKHPLPDCFYINDFRTGQRKTYKVDTVRKACRTSAAAAGSSV